MNTAYGYDSEEERSIENALKNEFTDYQLVFENDDIKGGTVPLGLLLAAVGMALVILVLMSGSWLEPVLFMITIGIAIIINMGTNIVFPYTADLTGSIAPIIQLALSMDYSIILMSRYRQEKENHDNKIDAMKAALSKSITSIASSSITTIAGLLALVFLSFKLGPELGIVLAKGILISMLCVFTVLPVLILACDKGIEKTKKKSPHISMSGLAKFSFKARFVVSIVFVILFISFFLIQKNTGITFTEKAEDKVADVFPKDNQVVLIYENKDEGNIHKITSELEDDEHVKSLLYFTDTLGKECDAEEMSDTIGELVDDVDINKEIVSMLYYLKFNGEMPTITPGEFLDFLKNDVMTNDMLTEYMGTELMEQMNSFSEKIANDPNPDSKFMNAIMSDQKLDAKQMNELLLSFTEDISEKDIELMYLYYAGIHQANENWTMTIPALFHYLCETVMNDERFSGIFDEEMKTETLKGKEDMDDAIEQMQGEKYSRLIITTDYLEEASDTSAFVKKVDELRNSCLEKSSYLVGTSVMVYEMENTFTKEFWTYVNTLDTKS